MALLLMTRSPRLPIREFALASERLLRRRVPICFVAHQQMLSQGRVHIRVLLAGVARSRVRQNAGPGAPAFWRTRQPSREPLQLPKGQGLFPAGDGDVREAATAQVAG